MAGDGCSTVRVCRGCRLVRRSVSMDLGEGECVECFVEARLFAGGVSIMGCSICELDEIECSQESSRDK